MENPLISYLNSHFGIAKHIEFFSGRGNLPIIKISNEKADALISLYAGQVLSFKPKREAEDFFFISNNAFFQQGKSIKGGIPICWPWFGDATSTIRFSTTLDLPNHGFARDTLWAIASTDVLENGDAQIVLSLTDSEKSRALWPYSFDLSLELIVGDSLTLSLTTRNLGDKPFFITEALHSYFNVGDATQVQLLGLEKTEYLDKAEGFVKACQLGAITISEETDHIHVNVGHDLIIDDPVFNRKIKITSSGNKNVVVWNPWVKGSEAIIDLESDDYRHFICVEIANTASGGGKIEIFPGCEYGLVTNYSC